MRNASQDMKIARRVAQGTSAIAEGRLAVNARRRNARRRPVLDTICPLVETQRYLDDFGRIVHGEPLTGDALKKGKEIMARGVVDLSQLDIKVESLCTKLMTTFPECLTKSFEELRKPKIEAWNRNKEDSRAWLALNMMAEARTGFRAFNEGPKDDREIDFVALRQRLAHGEGWTEAMIEQLIPKAKSA